MKRKLKLCFLHDDSELSLKLLKLKLCFLDEDEEVSLKLLKEYDSSLRVKDLPARYLNSLKTKEAGISKGFIHD